jgi:hypothetical protein
MLFKMSWIVSHLVECMVGIHAPNWVSSLTVSLQKVPMPIDPRPGRYVQHLDFNHFRTIGMRRSVEEGINNPLVTGDRIQAVLKVRLVMLKIRHGDADYFLRKCPI